MHVSLTSDNADETGRLYRWLRADRGVADTAVVRPGYLPGSTSMGALELIDVILGQAIAASSLALAVAAYRQARSRSGPIRVTRDDGATLTVDGADDRTATVIEAFLRDREAEEDDPGSPGGPGDDGDDR